MSRTHTFLTSKAAMERCGCEFSQAGIELFGEIIAGVLLEAGRGVDLNSPECFSISEEHKAAIAFELEAFGLPKPLDPEKSESARRHRDYRARTRKFTFSDVQIVRDFNMKSPAQVQIALDFIHEKLGA